MKSLWPSTLMLNLCENWKYKIKTFYEEMSNMLQKCWKNFFTDDAKFVEFEMTITEEESLQLLCFISELKKKIYIYIHFLLKSKVCLSTASTKGVFHYILLPSQNHLSLIKRKFFHHQNSKTKKFPFLIFLISI